MYSKTFHVVCDWLNFLFWWIGDGNCDWTSVGWKSKNSRLNQSFQRERTGSFHAVENLSISSKLILSTPERRKQHNLSFICFQFMQWGPVSKPRSDGQSLGHYGADNKAIKHILWTGKLRCLSSQQHQIRFYIIFTASNMVSVIATGLPWYANEGTCRAIIALNDEDKCCLRGSNIYCSRFAPIWPLWDAK